jgi:hypothetical protein
MRKLISTLTLAICLALSANAASLFSNKLDVYSCTTEDAARNCLRCTEEKNVTVQLDINVSSAVVIMTLYEGNKNLGGGPLEHCKVVDKKNWQCGDTGTYGEFNTFSQYTQSMSNGIFYSISRSKSPGIPRLNIKAQNTESFICAK